MIQKVNRDPLNEADEHIKKLQSFIDAAQELQTEDLDARDVAVDTLRYAVLILKQHYRNLLHCYALSEKNSKQKAD